MFLKAYAKNISATADEENLKCLIVYFRYFYPFLVFRLPWQPIKLRQLCMYQNIILDIGLLEEHFCKIFVKIFAKRERIFPLQVNDNFKLP